MKKLFILALCASLYACSPKPSSENINVHGTEWTWNDGTIVVKSPEREAGQLCCFR